MAFMPGIKIQPDSLIYFCLPLADGGLTNLLILYTSTVVWIQTTWEGLLSRVYVYWDHKNKLNNMYYQSK